MKFLIAVLSFSLIIKLSFWYTFNFLFRRDIEGPIQLGDEPLSNSWGGSAFEHPDSGYYMAEASGIYQSWSDGILQILSYPEYSNIVALLLLIDKSRVPVELFNIGLSLGIIVAGYYTVKNWGGSPKYAAALLMLDPYMAYLSTQILRETLILFGVSLTMLAASSNRFQLVLVGILIVGFMRSKLGLAFGGLIYGWNMISTWHIKTMSGAAVAVLLIFAIYNPLGQSEGDPLRVLRADRSLTHSAWAHTEFFNSGRSTEARPFRLDEVLLSPYFWTADNMREYAFSTYMIYWYLVLAVGVVGIVTIKTKRWEIWSLVGLVLIILYLLGAGTASQNPMIRWRVPLFLILVLTFSRVTDWKRVLDVIVCTGVIIASLPIWTISGLAIALTRTPIIFKQVRIGKDQKSFKVYKFTSMKNDQVTKIGQIIRALAIDEIPQMINVLKGDMSIVGPRPLIPEEQQDILDWDLRHQIKPGLIGPAQLELNKYDHANKLKWDLAYIKRVREAPGIRRDIYFISRGILRVVQRRW